MTVAPALLPPPFEASSGGHVPTDAQCLAWMEASAMEDHIRHHSLLVACVAGTVAALAEKKGLEVCVQSVRASALLHDLAKSHTILYGGDHSQIGGAWVQRLTGNPHIAQGVVHHICWPGPVDVRKHTLVLAVIYADKRVMHDRLVTLEDRFHDLQQRYGSTSYRQSLIRRAFDQAASIELSFNNALEVDLNAYSFDCGGMVKRA